MIDTTDSADITAAMLRKDPIDSIERAEPIDATDPNDPMLPTESTEPELPIDSTESLDRMLRTEVFDEPRVAMRQE